MDNATSSHEARPQVFALWAKGGNAAHGSAREERGVTQGRGISITPNPAARPVGSQKTVIDTCIQPTLWSSRIINHIRHAMPQELSDQEKQRRYREFLKQMHQDMILPDQIFSLDPHEHPHARSLEQLMTSYVAGEIDRKGMQLSYGMAKMNLEQALLACRNDSSPKSRRWVDRVADCVREKTRQPFNLDEDGRER